MSRYHLIIFPLTKEMRPAYAGPGSASSSWKPTQDPGKTAPSSNSNKSAAANSSATNTNTQQQSNNNGPKEE